MCARFYLFGRHDALHLLEKLVEWNLRLCQLVSEYWATLHLLEKLVEWKLECHGVSYS